MFKPTNLPKCTCFDFDDDSTFAMGRCAETANIARQLAGAMVHMAAQSQLCKTAMPFLLDTFIMSMLTHMATDGTAIECGTQEALWETERVLDGMEARILEAVRKTHEYARSVGLTAEKVQAMRDKEIQGEQS